MKNKILDLVNGTLLLFKYTAIIVFQIFALIFPLVAVYNALYRGMEITAICDLIIAGILIHIVKEME
jgi:hypothetical protein